MMRIFSLMAAFAVSSCATKDPGQPAKPLTGCFVDELPSDDPNEPPVFCLTTEKESLSE